MVQRRSSLASTLAFNECYGLGWDEYTRYAAGVLAVTVADVQRVAREYLDPRKEVVAIVKPDDAPPQVKRHELAQAAHRASPHDGKSKSKQKKRRHRR